MVRIPIPAIIWLSRPSDNKRDRWNDHHLGAVEFALSDRVR